MYMQNLTTYLLTSLSIFLFNRYRYNLNLKSFPTRRSSDLIYKEMYEEIKKDIDKIVDHILSINGIPYATMIKFIKEATIEEATADDKEEEMMEQLLEDLSDIINELNEIGLRKANETNDPLSAHLLIDLIKKLTHYRWRLQGFFGR